MPDPIDSASPDGTTNHEENAAAQSNHNADSEVKVGIQTPGGLPEWLVNATIEDLASPLLKREAPGSHTSRRT